MSNCDRRQSRAARHLVKTHLLNALASDTKVINADNRTIWDLLYEILDDVLPSDTTCPLYHASSRDIYYEHELASRTIPSQPSRHLVMPTVHRPGKFVPPNPWWYQCGICNKMFQTRYYLDLHLETKHINSKPQQQEQLHDEPALLCPARDWCHFLGPQACHDAAMLLEPYYGRGSGGYGPDQKSVRHGNARHAPSCNTRHRTVCVETIHDCFAFEPSLWKRLNQSVCAPLSCRDSLARLVTDPKRASSANVSPRQQQYEQEWDYYYQAHQYSWPSVLLAVFAGGAYACFYYRSYTFQTNDGFLQGPKRKQLLRGQSPSTKRKKQ
jgi:hypothetical protein